MNSENLGKKDVSKSKVGRPSRIPDAELIPISKFIKHEMDKFGENAAGLASIHRKLILENGLNSGKSPISSRTINNIRAAKTGSWPSVAAIAMALGYDTLEDFRKACVAYDAQLTEESTAGPTKMSTISDQVADRTFDDLLDDARRRVLSNPDIIRLTSLFQNTTRLKMDDAYVELTITHPKHGKPAPDTLVAYRTAKEQYESAAQDMIANRMSPQHALDKAGNATLILGDPGSGKSSLMRRMAINIAKGHWAHYDIALFITASDFAYRDDQSTTMVEFAWSQLYQTGPGVAAADLTNSEREQIRKTAKFIVLIDGLDEIANDGDAVEAVYDNLKSLNAPWIATSRPAGLMRRHETASFRLADLDKFAIEGLIAKWSKATFGETWQYVAETLTIEIGRSPVLVKMATNPFLLTALIYLKSSRPHDPLPQTRIQVYESLINNIAAEAQRSKDSNILTDEVQASLAKFSYKIFCSRSGPRQVFEKIHWDNFQRSQKTEFSLPYQVSGARLVTEENKLCRRYHFIHLSLQEHFVARHMVEEKKLKTVIKYRHSPAWRNAFISYGALLYERGETKTFKKLVNILWSDRDKAGQQAIILARILASAGIIETQNLINANLKEELYNAHFDQDTIIDNSGIRALAELSPNWLYEKKVREITDGYSSADLVDGDEWHPGSEFSFIGEQEFSPFYTLASTGTNAAYQYLKTAFYGMSQEHALEATPGFSQVSTYQDRQAVLEKGLSAEINSDIFFRCYTFFDCLRHRDGIPIFMRCLRGHWWNDETMRQQALQSIWLAGGDDAYTAMMSCADHLKLEQESGKQSLESYAQDILKYSAYLGGERSRDIFEFIETHVLTKNSTLSYRFNAGIVEPSEVKIRMTTSDERIKTIAALKDAAEDGFSASYAILSTVANVTPKVFDERLADFIAIEAHRPSAQNLQSLCPEIFQSCLRKIHSKTRDELSDIIEGALRVFTAKSYFMAAPIAHWALQNLREHSEAVGAAAEFLGNALFGQNDQTVLDTLETALFDPKIDARQDILHAIGRISPERVNLLRGHELGTDTVKMLASHHDILLFEDYWSDANGEQYYYKQKPGKLLCFFFEEDETREEEYSDMLQTVKMEASKHHYECFDFFEKSEDKLERYSGIIFIHPKREDVEAQKFFKTVLEKTSGDPKYKSFFNLPQSTIHLDEKQFSIEKIIRGFVA